MNEEAQATTPEPIESAETIAEISPEEGTEITADATPEEDTQDDAPEAGDPTDPEPQDQQGEGEEEFVGLDQFLIDEDFEEGSEDADNGEPFKLTSKNFKIPELDPDAQTNLTRWQQSWDGLLKQVKRVEAEDARVQEQADTIAAFHNLAEELSTLEGVNRHLEQMVAYSREKFNAVPDIVARTSDDDDWNNLYPQESLWDFDDPADPAKNDILKILESEGIDLAVLKQMQSEKEQERQRATFLAQVEQALPDVNRRLQVNYAGLRITSDDLAKAVEAMPGLDPYKAVVAYYEAPLRRVLLKRAKPSNPKKMPTMPKGDGVSTVGKTADLSSVLNVRLLG